MALSCRPAWGAVVVQFPKNVDGNISYQCFNQRCKLGESVNGKFVGKAPACLNGQLLVKGEGFADKVEAFSSNKKQSLKREHNRCREKSGFLVKV